MKLLKMKLFLLLAALSLCSASAQSEEASPTIEASLLNNGKDLLVAYARPANYWQLGYFYDLEYSFDFTQWYPRGESHEYEPRGTQTIRSNFEENGIEYQQVEIAVENFDTLPTPGYYRLKLTQSSDPKPNVLFILIDDLRPELGAYGSVVNTPHIDKLADQGMIFNQAYCNSAVCGASRASLLTGIRPGRHRFIAFNSRADADAPEALVLPQAFQDAGYTTVSVGKVFHSNADSLESWSERENISNEGTWRNYLDPVNLALDQSGAGNAPAYEIYEGDEAYRDELVADFAIEKLEEFKSTGEPFFLAAGIVKPHLPFNAPKRFWDLYDREAIEIPETYYRDPGIPSEAYHPSNELRNGYSGIPDDELLPTDLAKTLIHGYYATTSYIDEQVGRILQSLDDLGLRDNTIVVIGGDHGYNLGDHSLWVKHCNFDHAMRIPLIIDAPGAPGGLMSNALVELIDIYPTLTELAGLTPPQDQLEGTSLVPLLKDPEITWKPYIISKFGNGISLRTEQYLYTEWQNRNTGVRYARTLFDLIEDPLETENLAENSEYAETISALNLQLVSNWGEDFEKVPGE